MHCAGVAFARKMLIVRCALGHMAFFIYTTGRSYADPLGQKFSHKASFKCFRHIVELECVWAILKDVSHSTNLDAALYVRYREPEVSSIYRCTHDSMNLLLHNLPLHT